jgi:hypothetical protein
MLQEEERIGGTQLGRQSDAHGETESLRAVYARGRAAGGGIGLWMWRSIERWLLDMVEYGERMAKRISAYIFRCCIFGRISLASLCEGYHWGASNLG